MPVSDQKLLMRLRTAEKAKKLEWKEWDLEQLEFMTAPDGFPACKAIAGVYDIDVCPVPVVDTHPNCRCGSRVV